MIFGHLGIAFLLKSRFYKSSLILLIICCYIPDILFYIFFGIEWTIQMNYSSVYYGAIRWIVAISGSEFSLIKYPLPLSHSIIIYVIFISIFFIIYYYNKKSKVGLVYAAAIFIHLLCDYLLRDANIAAPIVYPLYPFDPSIYHFLPPDFILDANIFWMIDLLIFMIGFFLVLRAFSKNEGRGDLAF